MRLPLFLTFASWGSACLAETAIRVPELVNIGNTLIGTFANFTFNLRNVLDREVHIVQIHASCACTEVKLDGPEMLMPGEERSVSGRVGFPLKVGAYQTGITVEYQISNAPSEKVGDFN